MSHRRLFTPEQEQFIQDNIKDTLITDLVEQVNNRFNLSITPKQLRYYTKNHNLTSGVCCQFAKGQTPINKGKKMSPEVYEIVKRTMFKKGHTPVNHRPVGSERVNVDGYVEIKVAEPNKWRLKHQVIYEAANGKIPKGHCLIFLDGNKANVSLDNLTLISRQELVRLNKDNLIFQNKEMTKAGINITKIKLAYLQRQKEAKA